MVAASGCVHQAAGKVKVNAMFVAFRRDLVLAGADRSGVQVAAFARLLHSFTPVSATDLKGPSSKQAYDLCVALP